MTGEPQKANINVVADLGISEGLVRIFSRVADLIVDYRKGLRERSNDRWKQIFFTLDEAEKLTNEHLNAIEQVINPISESNDFITTYQNFKALVNDRHFPRAYGRIKGFLYSALKWPEFHKDPFKADLSNLICEIANFQGVVFMKDEYGEYDSLGVRDAFLKLKELWDIFSLRNQNTPISETELAKENQIKEDEVLKKLYQVEWIKQGSLKDMRQVNSRGDLIEFSRTWFRGWQTYVQNRLVVKDHLSGAIGSLRADGYKQGFNPANHESEKND